MWVSKTYIFSYMVGSVFYHFYSQSFAGTATIRLPALLTSLMITGFTVILLTYLVMPRLTPIFRK